LETTDLQVTQSASHQGKTMHYPIQSFQTITAFLPDIL
jgi:hypothetical protein